jgi:cytochrome c-type biogenesis protein CcmF
VSLGEKLDDSATSAWAVRVYHKPFVNWIWFGCLIMALGGSLAALDKRYRKKLAKRAETAPVAKGKAVAA